MHYGVYGIVKCKNLLIFICKFFNVQKGGPPKIGGPARPNSSNMPKAGHRWSSLFTLHDVPLRPAITPSTPAAITYNKTRKPIANAKVSARQPWYRTQLTKSPLAE